MDYYVLNTSLRLRDRRHSAVIVLDGLKVVPGQRFPLDKEGIQRNFSQLYHLQSIGAIEVRDAARGMIVDLSQFMPSAEPKVEARTEPVPAEPVAEPTRDSSGGPPGVSDLIQMADEEKAGSPPPDTEEPAPRPKSRKTKGRGRGADEEG